MKLLSFIILLLVMSTSITVAAPISTWSRAGQNACLGRCPQDWAESHLTTEELKQLNTVRTLQPNPLPIIIEDGDIFRLATYYKDGKPIAYRTTTIATLDEPTNSVGWHMDGWSWVQLEACGNWTIVEHQNINPDIPLISERTTPVVPKKPQMLLPPPMTYYPWIPINPNPWNPNPKPQPPAVPLPPSLVFLLFAVGSLLLIHHYKHRKNGEGKC